MNGSMVQRPIDMYQILFVFMEKTMRDGINSLVPSILRVSIVGAACFFGQASFAQTAATPVSAAPSYSSAGSMGGITYTVNGLKRNADDTVTLSVKIQGTAGTPVDYEDIGFRPSSDQPGEGYTLLDLKGKKRYSMLSDDESQCVCTKLSSAEIEGLGSGKAREIKIRFPAPPRDVTTISVELPHAAEPIGPIPITE